MTPNDPIDRDDELTPAERAALSALPRETEPSRMLEERTVRALRERGLLRADAPPRRRLAPWAMAAAAAGLALFTGGVAVGQWSAGRRTDAALEALRQQGARQEALLVERTGSAYLAALRGLTPSDTSAAGRAVAREMLRAVADEMVRIAPDDAVASGILATFDRQDRQRERPPAGAASDSTERVVWF